MRRSKIGVHTLAIAIALVAGSCATGTEESSAVPACMGADCDPDGGKDSNVSEGSILPPVDGSQAEVGGSGGGTAGASGASGAGASGGSGGAAGAPQDASPDVAPGCGDSQCNGAETCATCPTDCGACCGNNSCDNGETCASCSQDCGSCCGNSACDNGETCATCPADCGACCGNSACDHGETCASCPLDCGDCCGNGTCESAEGCAVCIQDCTCTGAPLFAKFDMPASGYWAVQCYGPGNERTVWNSTSAGSGGETRYDWVYEEGVNEDCGPKSAGVYPVIFKGSTTLPPAGTWVQQCQPGGTNAHIYQVGAAKTAEGWPYAPFHHTEPAPAGCP